MKARRLSKALGTAILLAAGSVRLGGAVEIPLESMSPLRMGYIDLQKVFEAYPEKGFAEGDLLREIEKRKRELTRRQTEIAALRAQTAADQLVREQAQAGRAVSVPTDQVAAWRAAEPAPAPVAPPSASTSTLPGFSSATAVEPYPTEEPLLGLPGHEGSVGAPSASPSAPASGSAERSLQTGISPVLDLLASATGPVLLNAGAREALEKRIATNKKALDLALYEFKSFRTLAIEDMKTLDKEKTYGVMSKIYATLQGLARDENVTVVLDKQYVLYGEDSVDLTDKLVARLNQPTP